MASLKESVVKVICKVMCSFVSSIHVSILVSIINAYSSIISSPSDRHVLPFPSLRHLNLANNQIEEEEGLLTLSTWPCLKEVVIWGNPVAISGKGGPPVVMYQLGLVSGIQVARYSFIVSFREMEIHSMSRDANPPLKRPDFDAVLCETNYFSSNFIEMNLQRKQKT